MITREWSRKNENITVDQRDVYNGYKAAIATINSEKGLVLMHVYDKAVKAEDFVPYLKVLSKKMKK